MRIEDILQAVSTLRSLRQSVENDESVEQFKAKLRSNRGPLEKIVALLGKEPAAREEAAAFQKLAREVEGFIRKQLSEIAAALADLDREGRLREGSARPGALMLRRLSDHLSHGSACCIALMI